MTYNSEMIYDSEMTYTSETKNAVGVNTSSSQKTLHIFSNCMYMFTITRYFRTRISC